MSRTITQILKHVYENTYIIICTITYTAKFEKNILAYLQCPSQKASAESHEVAVDNNHVD